MIGTRLGSHEVTAKLGKDGMKEVYRATRTKLDRRVAIKVLPAAEECDSEAQCGSGRGSCRLFW